MARRAIGIVRISQVRGRDEDEDSFASPHDQRERIKAECERRNLGLVDIIEEFDVSGATALEKRTGLRRAVEAVEAGDAQVIVASYFDRLVRSRRVQDELVSRVERAGGQVLAVDVGAVSNGSASQWLSGTMLGAVAEYHRRSTAERVRGAQAAAIARGVAPWKNTTPGFKRDEDGVFQPNEAAPAVRDAFRMRARGVSIRAIRAYLADHGVKRTPAAVGRLFHDRAVLGELHFGSLQNLEAHDAIVSPEEFEAARRASTPRGRQSKSSLLLARLAVLRCGTCGGRLCAGKSNGGQTAIYRCPSTSDCDRHVVISARVVEDIVTDAVREAIADEEGRASAEAHVREAEADLERAQADLDAVVSGLTAAGLADERAGQERLRELRQARDEARDRVEQQGGTGAEVVVRGADWEELSVEGRRELIKAVIERVDVAPGRGTDRVTVHSFRE